MCIEPARRLLWLAVGLAVWLPGVAVAQEPDPPDPGAAVTVEAVAWLTGCWKAANPRVVMEEQWMAPRGGVMLGMTRVTRNGQAAGHESLLIEVRGGKLVYEADPSNQPPAAFTATAIADDRATFENPEHDYPRRIAYALVSADSLTAQIDDGAGGGRAVFRFARARCGE